MIKWTPSKWLLLGLIQNVWKVPVKLLLYMLADILQPVPEISSLTEVFYKKVFWDASHIPELNTKTSHPEVFCKKRVIKSFTKFAGKHLSLSPFLIKLKAWRPATFFCILRILRNFQESFFAEYVLVTNSNITFFFFPFGRSMRFAA